MQNVHTQAVRDTRRALPEIGSHVPFGPACEVSANGSGEFADGLADGYRVTRGWWRRSGQSRENRARARAVFAETVCFSRSRPDVPANLTAVCVPFSPRYKPQVSLFSKQTCAYSVIPLLKNAVTDKRIFDSVG